MPIQCPQCKAVNRDTATFCDTCGGRLVITPADDLSQAAIPASPPAAAAPAHPSRPDSLPEEGPRPARTPPSQAPYQPPAPSAGIASIQFPKTKFGRPPRRRPWRWLPIIALGFGLFFAVISSLSRPWQEFMEAWFYTGLIALVLGIPVAIIRSQPVYTTGVVTHMQPWTPILSAAIPDQVKPTRSWVFDLKLVDRYGQALLDRRGFEEPVVQVEFREDMVRGQPLEEGCLVVVRGKYWHTRFKAIEIWNGSKASDVAILGAMSLFRGLVLGFHERAVPDLRYPGSSLQIWSFLLQPTDEHFNLVRDSQGAMAAPLSVEVRARSIGGPLADGDKVELRGQMVRGVIHTRDIRNITAGGAQIAIKEWIGIS